MNKENEWIVHFLNEATDEQIFHLFKSILEDVVRKDIEELMLKRQMNNPKK